MLFVFLLVALPVSLVESALCRGCQPEKVEPLRKKLASNIQLYVTAALAVRDAKEKKKMVSTQIIK